jgi:hypothetical protein
MKSLINQLTRRKPKIASPTSTPKEQPKATKQNTKTIKKEAKDTTPSQKRKFEEDRESSVQQNRRSGRFLPEAERPPLLPGLPPLPPRKWYGWGSFYGRARIGSQTGKTAALALSPGGKNYNGLSPLTNNPKSRPARFATLPSSAELPLYLDTPGGTKLKFQSNFNQMIIYEEVVFPKANENKENISTNIHAKKTRNLEARTFSTVITVATMEKAEKQIAQNNGRRICSQQQVKGGKASGEYRQYTLEELLAIAKTPAQFILLQETPKEWNHLIAHRIMANDAQVPENLVAGTKHANTNMLLVIEQHLTKEFVLQNEPVTLDVTAWVKPGTDCARTIDYAVKLKEMPVLLFKFDMNATTKPSVIVGEIAAKVIERKMENIVSKKINRTEPLSVYKAKNSKTAWQEVEKASRAENRENIRICLF